jgi:hypothetical protein
MVKTHLKQQYIILFQEHFISGLYLFQGDRYSIFQTGQDFWRALYSVITVSHPGRGGCADPVNKDAILKRAGGGRPSRNKERQFASDTGDGKT